MIPSPISPRNSVSASRNLDLRRLQAQRWKPVRRSPSHRALQAPVLLHPREARLLEAGRSLATEQVTAATLVAGAR